jgi:hypothetical protein
MNSLFVYINGCIQQFNLQKGINRTNQAKHFSTAVPQNLSYYHRISANAVLKTSVLVFCISGAMPTRSKISRHFRASAFAAMSNGSVLGGPLCPGLSACSC